MQINSLFSKVFFSFWLLLIILATSIIFLPFLDPRQLTLLSKQDQIYADRQIYRTQIRLEEQLARDPNLTLTQVINRLNNNSRNRNNDIDTVPDRSHRKHMNKTQYFLVSSSGVFANDFVPKTMIQFYINTSELEKPYRQNFKHRSLLGPFKIEITGNTQLLYLMKEEQNQNDKLVARLIDEPFLLLILALFITAPLCGFLSWHLTAPLRELTKVADQVSKGDLDVNFPDIKSNNEINKLAYSIQSMILSLKGMLTNQQRSLSDISHELRSPLTRLSLALAINRKHTGDNAELQRIDLESQRMGFMISEMLKLSKIQLIKEIKETLTVKEFLNNLFSDAQFEAKEQGKIFTYLPIPDLEFDIYKELAYRAVENVIRNAIKYANEKIEVRTTLDFNYVTISIENDGKLIEKKELASIFRPFYRIGTARDRESGGIGLGLSIAENAMIKHGGKIWAENIENKVVMHLQFPIFTNNK